MKHKTAKIVVDQIRAAMSSLDETIGVVQTQCDEAEFLVYRRALSHVYVAMADILNPLHIKYPDLDVDKVTTGGPGSSSP